MTGRQRSKLIDAAARIELRYAFPPPEMRPIGHGERDVVFSSYSARDRLYDKIRHTFFELATAYG